MYGCSDSVIVYGFNMGDREYMIDHIYLECVFHGINQYALDIVRHNLGEAIYGISCGLDKETGQAIINDEDKQKVKQCYDKYIEYLKKKLSKKDLKNKMTKISLGFNLAVSGDYETSHKIIILHEDWSKE